MIEFVIAGGGTAGHVHPGLSVARALVARGHDVESVLYVGSDRGIEAELVPAAGFELVTLPGRGIPRRLGLDALRAAASLARGIIAGIAVIWRTRPAVVLSLGGYAAVPCAVGALIRRVPVVIHEQNAVPGAANRLIARWAVASAVSYPDTPLPRATVTGNPVRTEMLEIDRVHNREEIRARLGIGADQVLIVATGGSLGALNINRAVLAAARQWSDRRDLVVHHVIGARDWDLLADERDDAAAHDLDYRAVRYEHDMASMFAAADLVVSRAGASTIAELAVVGVASVLVPLPTAPGDHQRANAGALVAAGAARLVDDDHLDGPRLCAVLEELLAAPGTLDAMARDAARVGRSDAADRVAQMLEDCSR
jgi:undecaprenyldiphospho-muramoylpentapeptide beta-N-acetylglucosaminyltransferase